MSLVSAFFAGTLNILFTWTALAAALVGVGLGFRRSLGLKGANLDQCVTAFWTGFALAVLFLQLWHFVFPITWHALAAVALAGASGLLANGPALRATLAYKHLRQHRGFVVLLFCCGLWVANHATAAGVNWDYGVYHLAGVRWTASYPIVPGLGNLQGRLAFNSSYYLYAAMLDTGPWTGKANHLANGLLATAFLSQVILAFRGFVTSGAERVSADRLELGLLAPALFLVVRSGDLASVITDLPVTIVLFVAASKLLDFLAVKEPKAREDTYALIVILLLATVAITIKLTAAGFALPVGLLAVLLWATRHGAATIPRRMVGCFIAIALAFAGSWMARGIVLSGYPAYPSGVFPAPVAWRVPAEQARAELAWTRHSGRWYYNAPTLSRGWFRSPDGEWLYDPDRLNLGWTWLPGWVSNTWRVIEHREGIVFPLVLIALGSLMCVVSRRNQSLDVAVSRRWWLLGPTILAILWWFTSAPSPRFGLFLLWIVAALLLVQALRNFTEPSRHRFALTILLAIGTLPLAARFIAGSWTPNGISLSSGLQRLVVPLSAAHPLLPSPEAPLRSFITDSGLELYAPVYDQRCWHAPLLCTPQPASNLALRREGDLRSGFVNADGRWRPEDFPDPRTYRARERAQVAPAADSTSQPSAGTEK